MPQTKQTLSRLRRHTLHTSVLGPLLVVMVVILCSVSPVGEFPLNDDWVYTRTVQELVEHHRYASHPFGSALALAQIFWGALFCTVFGFSFTVLRFSTLALALVAMWALARSAIECGLSRWTALLCSAVLLCNPIALNLAYTFMTDVPLLAPLTLAGLFYLRALRTRRVADVVWGSVFAVVASSIKQSGMLIAGAYALTELGLWCMCRRPVRPAHMAAFLAPWAVGLVLFFLMPGLGETRPWPPDVPRPSLFDAFKGMRWYTSVGLIYIGMFMFPLTCGKLFQLVRRKDSWTRSQWTVLPWFCILILFGTVRFQGTGFLWVRSMPMLPNVLYDLGTGPLTLRDTLLMKLPGGNPVTIGNWWWIVTLLCIGSAAIVCTEVFPPLIKRLFGRHNVGSKESEGERDEYEFAQGLFLFLWGFSVIAAPYHFLVTSPFDRYLLPALPPFAILCARGLQSDGLRGARVTAWTACALVLLFSLACVQDYMSWNRARWQGIDYLQTELKVPPTRIDGGFEFNGMYTSDEFRKRTGATSFYEWGPLGFWVLDDTYSISFQPRPGCRELTRIRYFSWLGMKTRYVLVLERIQQPKPSPQN